MTLADTGLAVRAQHASRDVEVRDQYGGVNLCQRDANSATLKSSFLHVLRFHAMSKIFLSHSSRDNGPAIAVAKWLQENGWDEYFLDLEPERGIAAGERWERALYQAATRCEAVLFLISRNWLASPWCLREMELAYKLNKHLFAVLIDDTPRAEVPKTISPWQMANLHRGQDHTLIEVKLPDQRLAQVTFSRSGLATLKEGLRRAQIDPVHFPWPPESEPDRAPWRGLEPLESKDAGIFFGRDGQTIGALDKIRALREAAPPRLMAIIGASGAGKSSFLRAGLIPRLKRDDHNYLVLPVIRPEGGALKALTASLGQRALELKLGLAQHDIGKVVSQATEGHPEGLSALLTRMAEAARPPVIDGEAAPPPAIVLPIDQGEELFHSSGRAEGPAFLSLLGRLLLLDRPRLVALVTIRSDSYDLLQRARELEDIRHEAFSLPPLARGNYADVIRRPLEILNRHLVNSSRSLKFDPAIIERLTATLDEGAGRDALPLLAFTLARLYRDFHARGHISVADYDAMGGVGASIDAAVDSALARAARDRRTADGAALQDMLRQAMIPRFAGIDPETGTARRRTARYDTLPAKELPLVDALIEERLLARDNGTVEPAHEALLREWKALTQWLAEDREQLIALEGVRRAAADWLANGQRKDYLAHREGRLASAEGLAIRPDLWGGLTDSDHAYLRACREAENAAHASRERVIRVSAVIVGLFFLAALGAAWFAWDRHRTAQSNLRNAQQAEMDELAQLALSRAESNPVSALKLVLGVWPESGDGPFPKPSVAFQAISSALTRTRPHVLMHKPIGRITSIAISSDGTHVVIGSNDGILQLWDTRTNDLINMPYPATEPPAQITSIIFSPDDKYIISGDEHGTLILWDSKTREHIGIPALSHNYSITSLAFPIGDSSQMTTGDATGTLGFWGISDAGLKLHRIFSINESDGAPITSMAFSRDGTRLASGDTYDRLSIWDTTTYEQILTTIAGEDAKGGGVTSVSFSHDNRSIISGHQDGAVRWWDMETGNIDDDPVSAYQDWNSWIVIAPGAQRVAHCNESGAIRLWDPRDGARLGELMGNNGNDCAHLVLSADGRRVASVHLGEHSDSDDVLRLWDIQAGQEITWLTGNDLESDEPASLNAVAFTADGSQVITGDSLGRIHSLESKGGYFQIKKTWPAHSGGIDNIFTLAGTDVIATTGPEEQDHSTTWKLWDTNTGELKGEPRNAGLGSFFSPDGMYSVSVTEDGSLYLGNTNSGDEVLLLGHEANVSEVIFSPGGTRFVTTDIDRNLRIWGVDGKERTRQKLSYEDCSTNMHFSHDSSSISCVDIDRELRLWDVETGVEGDQRIVGGTHEIASLDFSHDGTRIVTGDASGVSRLFDTRTGAQIGASMGSTQHTVIIVALAPNGMTLATYNTDEQLTLWDTSYPPGNILQIACHYLPVIDGRPDTSTDGLTAEIVNMELSLPTDCDSYDPPLPPEYRQ